MLESSFSVPAALLLWVSLWFVVPLTFKCQPFSVMFVKFPSKDVFEQVFMQVTDNYGCMVIDNRLRTNDIKKKVFWYKAKNRKKFKIGSRKFNKFHKKYFNPKYDEKKKVLDMSSFISNRVRKSNIVVKKEN